jgi:hypothetical protein
MMKNQVRSCQWNTHLDTPIKKLLRLICQLKETFTTIYIEDSAKLRLISLLMGANQLIHSETQSAEDYRVAGQPSSIRVA